MAKKTTHEKVASAFKTLLARAEQVRVNNTEVTSATANCLGKWSITMKLKGGKELALDDKALDAITYDKGDFVVHTEDGKKENRIAFYSMKKKFPGIFNRRQDSPARQGWYAGKHGWSSRTMDRHCVNSKAADQFAHQCGQEDDRELAIERLELEWFEALEVCISQSGNPQLMHFLDGYSDTISQLLNSMARRHLTT